MYFRDPNDGARRRAVARDKFLSGFGRMANSLERLSRHLWNKTVGASYEVRSSFMHDQPNDRVLTERVRSAMGRTVRNIGEINVRCMNGRVTLSGRIAPSEQDGLLRSVWSVRGVNEVTNQLEVRDAGNVAPAPSQSSFAAQR